MTNRRFDYSLNVARRIYSEISSETDAIEIVNSSIEKYYTSKGLNYTKNVVNNTSTPKIEYKSKDQTITFYITDDKPTSIVLRKYDLGTNKLVEAAYNSKELFGLPVFTITVMQDLPVVHIHLMSRNTFVSLDTPEEQSFRDSMDFWTELDKFL